LSGGPFPTSRLTFWSGTPHFFRRFPTLVSAGRETGSQAVRSRLPGQLSGRERHIFSAVSRLWFLPVGKLALRRSVPDFPASFLVGNATFFPPFPDFVFCRSGNWPAYPAFPTAAFKKRDYYTVYTRQLQQP
ncbi:MAG: hypothetical protein ACI4W2_05555, partial [Eubacterium sp.]